MKKIKKLNKIILSEINQFAQKAIIGGRKCLKINLKEFYY